jgi:hypothetical protein
MKTEEQIREQYRLIRGSLDERGRREWAASEAMALGYGGIALVRGGTGFVPSTIGKGINELRRRHAGEAHPEERRSVRRPGGGRPRKAAQDPELLGALEALVEPCTRGDPESALRWTCKGLRVLAEELARTGHDVSYRTVGRLLKHLNYRLQGNKKTLEGAQHIDRDARFAYINAQTKKRTKADNPAISVDTKKELVGDYRNGGREYRPKGQPEKVDVHDFNSGWVSVGISADTSESAVETIRRWWNSMGHDRYPQASELFITADCGGSNGYRTRLWKLELQRLADELGIPITVCHFLPGTSKWNKIEHRLFSFITFNWRGNPLRTYQTVVNLIAATTTRTGLEVQCELDPCGYEKGRKVSDAEMKTFRLRPHRFHGEWNYTIDPHSS